MGDGIDQNCDGIDGTDVDGDGVASVASGGDDCADHDDTIGPFATDGAVDCNRLPLWPGDMELKGGDDIVWFCENYSGVRGSLGVSDMANGHALACLESVGGDLTLSSVSDSIELTGLTDVGGSLIAMDVPLVRSWSFPALRIVQGTLSTGYGYGRGVVDTVDLPVLAEAGGIYTTLYGPAPYFSAPELTTVQGDFGVVVRYSPFEPGDMLVPGSQSFVDAGKLESVSGLFVYGIVPPGPALPSWLAPSVDFGALMTVGDLAVMFPGRLEFANLASVDGSVSVYDPTLLDLPVLTSVAQNVSINSTGGLSAPFLGETRSLSVEQASVVDLISLTTLDNAYFWDTTLLDLQGMSSLTEVRRYLNLDGNRSLEDVSSLLGLQSVGYLTATCNTPVTDADFFALAEEIPELGGARIAWNGPEWADTRPCR